jgi:CRISPR-associated protein Csm3
VPSGARFRVRMVLDLLCAEDAPLAALVVQGLRLLEDDALGGGGSRGSGRVRFDNLKMTWRAKDYYASGAPEREIAAGADLAALQAKVQEIGDSLVAA